MAQFRRDRHVRFAMRARTIFARKAMPKPLKFSSLHGGDLLWADLFLPCRPIGTLLKAFSDTRD